MITLNLQSAIAAAKERLRSALESQEFFRAMAQGVARLIRGHLALLDATRKNALGGKRTHFYAAAAKSLYVEAEEGGSAVTIPAVGFRQRYEGGPILPVVSKWLTIPATAEAYGRRAREFDDIEFAIIGGKPALVRKEDQGSVDFISGKVIPKAKRKKAAVLFWLRKSVFQQADPTVMPSDLEMEAAAVFGGEAYLASLKGAA